MTSDIITEMLGLTADIAEGLLAAKDEGLTEPSDNVIRQISRLNEIAMLAGGDRLASAEAPSATDDIIETVTEEITPGAISETTKVNTPADVPEIAAADIAEPISESSQEAVPEAVTNSVDEAESALDEETADALPDGPSAEDLRRSMSLNDLFLFRRALFGGSASRMELCLKNISGCADLDGVKQILQHDFGINLRQSEAKSFMAAVEPFFAI